MEINPNRSVDAAAAAAGPVKSRGVSQGGSVDAEEETSFIQSDGLNAALQAVPDSRADVVARAESLVSSSSYPPPEMIQRIANLLAANLLADES
jgi:hypothetical protein